MTSDDDDIQLTIKLLAWDPKSLCPPTCPLQGPSGVHFLSLDQIILSALSINILPILDINILPVLSFSRACPHACRNAKPWGIRKILIDIIRTDDLDKIPDENRLARYVKKLHKCRLWHFSTVASQWSGVLGSADIHWRVQ